MTNEMSKTTRPRTEVWVEVAGAMGLLAVVVGTLLLLAVAVVPAAGKETANTGGAVVPKPAGDPPAVAGVAPARAASDAFAVDADPRLAFVLELGNRMYPDWKETRRVRLDEPFIIGDTEFSAVVTKLMPDFLILDGKPRSVSAELKNPAVRVLVSKNGAPADSAWAFLNFPPHFSPRSFFTFQLKEVVGYKLGAAAASGGDSSRRHGGK
jgi:hypothetical protein